MKQLSNHEPQNLPLSRLMHKLRASAPDPTPLLRVVDPSDPDDVPCAPAPEIINHAALATARRLIDEETPPPADQAIVHLALLEAFWKYNQRYLDPADELKAFFGRALWDADDRVWTTGDVETVWHVVLEVAVRRFWDWWDSVAVKIQKDKGADWPKGAKWNPEDGVIKTVSELSVDLLPPIGWCLRKIPALS